MYTILRYANGRRADALILSASPDLIRVILRRQGDTAELRRVFGDWIAEDGSPVELESIVAGDHTDLRSYCVEARQRALGAN
jgi:hypothetical protein